MPKLFKRTSLSSNDSNRIGQTIYLSSMNGALLVYSFEPIVDVYHFTFYERTQYGSLMIEN